jgi:CHAD domain-containing protein
MPKIGQDRRDSTCVEALGSLLVREVGDLRKHEAGMLEDPESVQEYRVSARRLRSLLAGYEPLFERTTARTLRQDLRLAGDALRDLRDQQALAERIERLVVDESSDHDVALARRQLTRVAEPGSDPGSIVEHLIRSPDYDDFVRRLERFGDLPPWTAEATKPAVPTLQPLLQAEWRRFRAGLDGALAGDGTDAADRLHNARKAATRAHYVFEWAEPVFGRRAGRNAKAARRVQRVLGQHRDSTRAQRVLGLAVAKAERLGEDTFVLRRLLSRESLLTEELWANFEQLVVVADRKKLRRWFG